MYKILDGIFANGKVVDVNGNTLTLHSHTSFEQCIFLQKIISEIQPTVSLEIGLAYGISTLAILEALNLTKKPFQHIVVDPFQESWNNIGLLNIEKTGNSSNVIFFRKFSDEVIPQLYYEKKRIQFAYIDTTKVFDVLLADIYFITKILDVGGVIVLDDCGFPGIRLLARFLAVHPSYEIYRSFNKDSFSWLRRCLRYFSHLVCKALPFKQRGMPNYNFKSDSDLGVNYHCISFKKTREDTRNWDWYEAF